MKKYWGVSLLYISSIMLNGSDVQNSKDKNRNSDKARRTLSAEIISTMMAASQLIQNPLTSSAPMDIPRRKKKNNDDLEVIYFSHAHKIVSQSPDAKQVITPGDFFGYDRQSYSPSPYSYSNR